MKTLLRLSLIGFVISGCALAAQTPATPPTVAQAGSHAPVKREPDAERGERAFKANCSRCHNAPESLNPRITGTVIRHMRVRANLSAADERDILRYLNP